MKELLEALLAIVEERRAECGEKFKTLRRKADDYGPASQMGADLLRQADHYHMIEDEMKRLWAQMEQTICEQYGDRWRGPR